MADLHQMQLLAATHDRLIATTSDGKLGALSLTGKFDAQWACGTAFVSQPAVADIDGDGINEVVVCRAGGKVAALRTSRGSKMPKKVWEVEGSGLYTAQPPAVPVALLADVNGDGRKEILINARGCTLLDGHGKTLWTNPVYGFRGTFGDFDGDGHPDVYLTAWSSLPNSIGNTVQSFAINGRTGKLMWHNDGQEKAIWHHQLGVQHRQPTVCDVNGDGAEDVLMVAMDLVVELSGRDGAFLHDPAIANAIWKQQPGQDHQWTAYGTQIRST